MICLVLFHHRQANEMNCPNGLSIVGWTRAYLTIDVDLSACARLADCLCIECLLSLMRLPSVQWLISTRLSAEVHPCDMPIFGIINRMIDHWTSCYLVSILVSIFPPFQSGKERKFIRLFDERHGADILARQCLARSNGTVSSSALSCAD